MSALGKLPCSRILKRLGIKRCPMTSIPLAMFGGAVEASSFQMVDLAGCLIVLESHLSHNNPIILVECIEILNIYIKQRCLNSKVGEVSEEESNLIRSSCHILICHWDSHDTRVMAMVTNFFAIIFELIFTTNRLPTPLADWISVEIIEKCILGGPYCINGPVILTKGSLRLIKTLVIYAPLSWVSCIFNWSQIRFIIVLYFKIMCYLSSLLPTNSWPSYL